MQIAYLVHNLNDPAVERRCTMLERGGAVVRLAGFCRDEHLSPAIAARQPLILGQSKDAAMAQRALATVMATAFNTRLRKFVSDCDIVMARNLEQLGIARAIVGARPLVYECLDIHHTLVGTGKGARAVQAVEARLLPRVDLLLTSSPAFVDNHFETTTLDSPIELVENKLLVADASTFSPPRQYSPEQKLRIGWFGMLRCQKTFEVLKEISAANRNIEILIAGRPSKTVFPDFVDALAGHSQVEFAGEYTYADLPDLYGRCHFAWTIDWFEEGENSSWLLPNRIYEAVAHGCIPVALSGIEVGRWLARHGAGLLIADPKDAGKILSALKPQDIAALQQDVLAVPQSDVLADDSDCRKLVARLAAIDR